MQIWGSEGQERWLTGTLIYLGFWGNLFLSSQPVGWGSEMVNCDLRFIYKGLQTLEGRGIGQIANPIQTRTALEGLPLPL